MTGATAGPELTVLAIGDAPRFVAWCREALGEPACTARSVPEALRLLPVVAVDVVVLFLPELDVIPRRAFEELADGAPAAPLIGVRDGGSPVPAAQDLELVAAGMTLAVALDTPKRELCQAVEALANRPRELRQSVQHSRRVAQQLMRYESWSSKSIERLDEWIHELRTPLGVIQGFTANLIDAVYGNLSRAQLDAISRIRNGGELLCSLVEQVRESLPAPPELEFDPRARRTAGRARISLEAVCREVVEFFETAAESAGIRLELFAEACPEVWGDRMRLTQGLVNLLKNACRFTPRGGSVVVRVGPAESDSDGAGPHCAITVSDTGPGISEENRARVLEPGFTTDADLGHQGMGLHVVQQVTKEHGGRIELDGGPGRGAIFRLVVPVDPRRRRRKTTVRLIRDHGLAVDLLCALRNRPVQIAEIVDRLSAEQIEELANSGEVTLLATDEPLGTQIFDLLQADSTFTSVGGSRIKENSSAHGADR